MHIDRHKILMETWMHYTLSGGHIILKGDIVPSDTLSRGTAYLTELVITALLVSEDSRTGIRSKYAERTSPMSYSVQTNIHRHTF